MQKWFEQPTDEVTRLLLRLESLFVSFKRSAKESSETATNKAMCTLVRILSVTDRTDLKSKLVTQVMQQVTSLSKMKQSPHVDAAKLDTLLETIEADLVELRSVRQGFGSPLRHNQLLNTVRAQLSSPGGLIPTDAPAYALWLQQPAAERKAILSEWMNEFALLERVSLRVLSILRESGELITGEAVRGHYEQALDPTQPHQLVRVKIKRAGNIYPMVSIGKHRVAVQFYQIDNVSQGVSQKCYDNVSFQLVLARL